MKRGSRCTDFLPLPLGEGRGEGAGAPQRTAFAWPTLAALALLAGSGLAVLGRRGLALRLGRLAALFAAALGGGTSVPTP